jgi:Amt family ammonium transporter
MRADTGDTAWMLVASALVLFMTPGPRALLRRHGAQEERARDVHVLVLCARVGHVQWVLFGYSLAFGRTHGGSSAASTDVACGNVGVEPAGTIPHLAFMAFQLKFAIITPALISRGVRRAHALLGVRVFTLLWTTLVYDPVAHWTWGEGGWLAKLGVLDFAGGTVVHWTAGVSALVCAL